MPTNDRMGRIVALLDRFGHDKYNRSIHPLLRVVQDHALRCSSDCPCGGCSTWRGMADGILDFLEQS